MKDVTTTPMSVLTTCINCTVLKIRVNNIAAKDLQLWKINIPYSDVVGVKDPDLSADALQPLDDIEDIFPEEPLKKHVHIIVKPPPQTLSIRHNSVATSRPRGDVLLHVLSNDSLDE